MPEQDAFLVGFAAGLFAGDDFAEFRVERLRRELSGAHVRAEAAELSALFALPPVVDDYFVHHVGQRDFVGAYCSVRHHEAAGADPLRLQQRLRLHQARRFDHDVRALEAFAAVFGYRDFLM